MNLTNVDTVKSILEGGIESGKEPMLTAIIASVSASAVRYMDRQIELVSRTEYFDVEPLMDSVQLSAWPITSITSVHYDPERTYGTSALIDSDDYTFTEYGRLLIDYCPNGTDRTQRRALKVIYTGGLADDADELVANYPDLSFAVARQCVHEFRRSASADGSNFSITPGGGTSYQGQVEWLEIVLRTLNTYARATLCG